MHTLLDRFFNQWKKKEEDEVEEFSPSSAQQVPLSGCMHAGLMQTAHALE